MGDMTYDEIQSLKSDIKAFDEELKKYAETKNRSLNENDISFFNFISKRILFFKFFSLGDYTGENEHFCKVLISDFYFLIISIINFESRYIYVNERSIIENYIRLITHKSVEEDHVTGALIDSIKDGTYLFDFTDDDFSLLKSEYKTACEFVHGGDILENSLMFVFKECLSVNWSQDEVNDYYTRIMRLVKSLDKLVISEYKDFVGSCFHRRKTLIDYLLGKEALELLFL